jgi:uncharacterized protein involved in tolerance to divalent cations
MHMTDAVRSKYQWPASRLDEKEMALLFRTKQRTHKSICELLRQAIHIAYVEVVGEKNDDGEKKG